MRYATVNNLGKVVGIFVTEPELLEYRPLKSGEFIVECLEGTVDSVYYNGTDIVNRVQGNIQHTVNGNVVTITNLPNDSKISVIGNNGLQVLSANGSTEITLSMGMNMIEIDPWPYLHTNIAVNIE